MISTIDKDLAQQIVNTVKDVCGYDVNSSTAPVSSFQSSPAALLGNSV